MGLADQLTLLRVAAVYISDFGSHDTTPGSRRDSFGTGRSRP